MLGALGRGEVRPHYRESVGIPDILEETIIGNKTPAVDMSAWSAAHFKTVLSPRKEVEATWD